MSTFTRRRFLLAGAGGLAAVASCSRQEGEPDRAGSELQERLSDLEPEPKALPPFPPASIEDRQARLRHTLSSRGLEAILLGPTVNLRYVTDTRWGASERLFGCLFFAGRAPLWICPAFEETRARETVPLGDELRTWHEDEDPHALVLQLLDQETGGRFRLAVDSHARATHALRLAALAPAGALEDGLPVMAAVRACKTEPELARIRRACEITQRAIDVVRERFLSPGVTEATVRTALAEAQRRLGLTSTWALALFGPNAAFPHGSRETTAPLTAGQTVLIDTGGELDGYQSDVSRTFFVGAEPTARQAETYRLVREAQKAAVAAMGHGVPCARIDAAARQVIVDGGYGPGFRFFTHRLGHGIGLEGHEDPYFCGNDETPLLPGMTLSNEPGIYVPGELGVRLEDIVALTGDGAVTFGASPADELPVIPARS